MFDLIAGNVERPLRERSPRSQVVAVVGHIVVVTLLVGIPLLRVTDVLPDAPTVLAFVVAPPAPPPPPLKAAAGKAVAQPEPKPTGPAAAPLEPPGALAPEPAQPGPLVDAKGVEGGVEGGIAGGMLGGIVGGLVAVAPPPPPLPLPVPAAPPQPVRIGGQLAAPGLLYRVEPVYPEIAASTHAGGMVILEALVGTDGCVESVKVLRSASKLLSGPSADALKQWKYSPLLLNGIPTPFVLTVTFNFSVKR